MSSKQIRDVIVHVRDFKRQLVTVYRKVRQAEQDENVQLLLDYLSRHEERIEAYLDHYEQEVLAGILDTWVQFVDDEALRTMFRDVPVHTGMSPDELVATSLQYDAALVQVYRDIADATSSADIEELFTNLANMEENKDHQYARSLLD